MAEDVIEEEKVKESKLNSRKFLVWITWAVISVVTLAIGVITMVVTKSFPTTVVDLVKLTMGYFFYISLVYLGVNGIQKVGFAISDAVKGVNEK